MNMHHWFSLAKIKKQNHSKIGKNQTSNKSRSKNYWWFQQLCKFSLVKYIEKQADTNKEFKIPKPQPLIIRPDQYYPKNNSSLKRWAIVSPIQRSKPRENNRGIAAKIKISVRTFNGYRSVYTWRRLNWENITNKRPWNKSFLVKNLFTKWPTLDIMP